MLNTSSAPLTPATPPVGAASPDASRPLLTSRLPWQSVPKGFVDYSECIARISPRIRAVRRLAVAPHSAEQHSLRDAFDALGLLQGTERLDEARINQLMVEGHDGAALRALETLSGLGLIHLGLRLNTSALRRTFFANEPIPPAAPSRITLPALLALKGCEAEQLGGGMPLVDRFLLLQRSGHDLHESQYLTPQGTTLASIVCCAHSAPKPHTTLMHLAAEAGNVNALEALAQAGLDINAMDDRHFTPLMQAAHCGRADAAGRLLELGADKEAKSHPDGMRAAHLAAMADTGETLRSLAAYGANLEARAAKGLRPLHVAAGLGRPEAIATLAVLGCDLEPRGEGRAPLTPLALAAAQGKTESIVALARAGAPLDTQMAIGRTALHVAAINNQGASITALHEQGAALDAADDQGNTALHIAAILEKVKAGKALIRAGCRLNLRNKDNQRPVDEAGLRSNPEMFHEIRIAGAEGPFRYIPSSIHSGGI